MTDFYEELRLDRSKRTEELLEELNRLEKEWIRKETVTPEKAILKRAFIIQARKVFASDISRRAYDVELAKSKEKPIPQDPNDERKKQFEKWNSEACIFFDSKQYDLARTAVDRALSYYDTSTDNDAFYYLVAKVYYMNRIYSTALSYINSAIVINRQSARYYATKAIIYHDQAFAIQGYDGYNYGEFDKLIQNSRFCLNKAVDIAHQNNDRILESNAYGMLAAFSYFVPRPDRVKAEEYAKKSVDLGDESGYASKVLAEINKIRQQEIKAAEEEKAERERRAKAEQAEQERKAVEEYRKLKKIQEEQARREREAEEKRSREAQEKHRTRLIKHFLVAYIISWVVFFGWLGVLLYMDISDPAPNGVYKGSVEVFTAVAVLIVATNVFFRFALAEEDGICDIEDFFYNTRAIGLFSVAYAYIAARLKYDQRKRGSIYIGFFAKEWKTEDAWFYFGNTLLIYAGVIIVFGLIGIFFGRRKLKK